MATRENDKIEPSKIVGAISKLAGTLVGTAVVTGKRIVRNVTPASGASGELKGKSVQAPAKRKRGATDKKKRKAVKRKGTSKARKGGTSEEKSVRAPVKANKKTTRREETKDRKTKKKRKIAKREVTNPRRKVGTAREVEGVNEPEPQPEVARAELYSDKLRNASVSTDSVS